MTDAEDIISLTEADDEPKMPSLQPVDVARLSPEARLATALVMQAQVLDGMRRSQDDLLARLETAGGRESVQASIRSFGDTLQALAEMQGTVARQVQTSRRRTLRWVTVAVLVVLVGMAGATWWITQDVRQGALGRDELMAAFRAADPAGRAVVRKAVSSLEASVDALAEKVDQHDRLAAVVVNRLSAERDEAQQVLAVVRKDRDELAQGLGLLTEEVASLRDDRQRLLGENTRLHGDLLDRERGRDELLEVVAGLQQQAATREAQPEGIVFSPPAQAPQLLAALNEALRASGATDTHVAEIGSLTGGELKEVLFIHAGEGARADRAFLVARAGVPLLRFTGVRTEGGQVLADRDVELPVMDVASFADLGLTVPRMALLPEVREALQRLLAPTGYRVVRVDGCQGGVLQGVVLKLEDNDGVLLRMLTATRGLVRPEGPELVLEEGSVRAGGEDRPFFRGTFRLPLPDSDVASWRSVVSDPGS